MKLMSNTKKQLVILLEGHQHKLQIIRKSAGTLRKAIYDLNLDPETRAAVIGKIDKHINEL
jgi:hypothetical protein